MILRAGRLTRRKMHVHTASSTWQHQERLFRRRSSAQHVMDVATTVRASSRVNRGKSSLMTITHSSLMRRNYFSSPFGPSSQDGDCPPLRLLEGQISNGKSMGNVFALPGWSERFELEGSTFEIFMCRTTEVGSFFLSVRTCTEMSD